MTNTLGRSGLEQRQPMDEYLLQDGFLVADCAFPEVNSETN